MIKRSRVRVPAEATGNVFSLVSVFCVDSYFGIRSTPVLPQQNVNEPRSFFEHHNGVVDVMSDVVMTM